MRFRELAKLVEQLKGGGGGVQAPDVSKLHYGRDPVYGATLDGWDPSDSTIKAFPNFVEVRGHVFDPPLADDEGYFIQVQWLSDAADDGIDISTTPADFDGEVLPLMRFRQVTPPTGLVSLYYMAPGYTLYLENVGATGRFVLPNAYGTL